MITYYQDKINEIFEKNVGSIHLSRKKCMFSLLMNIMEKRSVQFVELAQKFNESAKTESNLRRIQSFFSDYEMNYEGFGKLWLSLHEDEKLTLCIDRTNWKFGNQNINILFLTAYYKGVGFPIFFELLDKKGNSNQGERMDLLEQFITLFGKERIGKIIGDREFIGGRWLFWLQKQGIPFVIRVPKNHLITFSNAIVVTSEQLLGNQNQVFQEKIWIDDVLTNIVIKKLEKDYLIVIGDFSEDALLAYYKQRWSIETFFESIKTRGFNLEETHLDELPKLKKLIALVNTAYIFCLKIGVWYDENVKKIKLKNHGYKANSFFRYGLNIWRDILSYIQNKQQQMNELFSILFQKVYKNNIQFVV